jgi:hypothetical protein
VEVELCLISLQLKEHDTVETDLRATLAEVFAVTDSPEASAAKAEQALDLELVGPVALAAMTKFADAVETTCAPVPKGPPHVTGGILGYLSQTEASTSTPPRAVSENE